MEGTGELRSLKRALRESRAGRPCYAVGLPVAEGWHIFDAIALWNQTTD